MELTTTNPDAAVAQELTEETYTHNRTGKVARLPKEVRDHLNQMLLDGVPFAHIIDRLGEHGKELNEDNVSNWKKGGYKDWLMELERKEALTATRDAALTLVKEKAGGTVQDAGRAIAAAQLFELLISFDPTAFAKALADKPELYLRLISVLARLSEGEAACGHYRAKESAVEKKVNATAGGTTTTAKLVDPETLKEIARLIKLL